MGIKSYGLICNWNLNNTNESNTVGALVLIMMIGYVK